MARSAREIAFDQIRIDEGFRSQLYKCPSDKWTIGYGRNLEDNGITELEAEILLKHDLQQAQDDASQYAGPVYLTLSPNRKAVLINMAFNLGLPRLSQFVKLKEALIKQDFAEAAVQMLDSRWHDQVGVRAQRLAKQMKEG